MSNWSPEQLAIAAEYIQANIDNPDAIAQRRDELGLTNDDLLQAAQTVDKGITLGQVQEYLGETPKPKPRAPAAAPAMQAYQANPYLDQMAAGIVQQTTRNLNEQIMPGLRSQAIAAGGFGDARHGVAEGLAIGRTNDALANSLANLYGTDYQKAMDRNAQIYQAEMQNQLGYAGLDTQRYGIDQNNATQRYSTDLSNATQRYGIDQNYNLGMTNAGNTRYGIDKNYDVGMASANASMANAQASQTNAANNYALAQQQFGVNTMFGLLDRQNAYSNSGINMGTTIQDTPYNNYQRFTNVSNSIGNGYANSSASSSGARTDPLTGAANLMRIGSSWINPSGGNVTNPYQTTNGGWGTGNDFGNQDLGTFI